MTQFADIQDEKYKKYLDHGFVGLVDYMGSDEAIVQAARTSYGKGTKTVLTDRNLIRYLIRHHHWTPVEMCEIKWHLKIPIFIMRQLVRHRTANINEYSLRYSLPEFDFYVPEYENTSPQSLENNQGRSSELLLESDYAYAAWLINTNNDNTKEIYNILNTPYSKVSNDVKVNAIYGAYDDEDGLSLEYPGIAKELSRMVLPVNLYTELYWKCDLRNIFNLLRLRMDSHAQFEVRELANIMYESIKHLFPFACEAFEDYILHSQQFSRMEMLLIADLLAEDIDNKLSIIKSKYESNDEFLEHYGLSKREWTEFSHKLNGVF